MLKGFMSRAAATMLLGMAMLGSALAQSDPFTTAVADATAKVNLYAAALVGVSAIAVIFMIAMKYIKKLPRAA